MPEEVTFPTKGPTHDVGRMRECHVMWSLLFFDFEPTSYNLLRAGVPNLLVFRN